MKIKRRLWEMAVVLLLVAGAAAFWRSRTAWRRPGEGSRIVIPVFVLHRVLPGEATEYIISPEKLDALLDELNRRRFTPVSLGALNQALRRKGPLPRRPALVTFDDAYLDLYRHALPVLQKHKWPAVFFVPAGKINDSPADRVQWGDGPDPVAMQWLELLELKKAGMEIGSHALNHVNLAKADPETARLELMESRRILGERLGEQPIALAYPGGRHSREVRQAAAEAGYQLAFLSGGGPVRLPAQDLYALPRVHVAGYADPRAIVRSIPENEWR